MFGTLTPERTTRLADAFPGLRLGPVLGSGAGGWVVEATDVEERPIALKVLADAARGPDGADDRARTEAEVLLGVRHRNLLRANWFVELEDMAVLSVELVRGPTLLGNFGTPHRDVAQMVRAIAFVADALEEIHTFGFIHGDVKPDNVFAADDGRTVLFDLGLARRIGDPAPGPIGTPWFVAPERVLGEAPRPENDVYACAISLYELLAGHFPFPLTHSWEDTLRQHVELDPADLCSVAPRVPRELGDVVMNGLRREPSGRQSASEFAEGLRSAANHEMVVQHPPTRRATRSVR